MLRGCQKKVYHVKNVSGRYFEEAYLILKNDVPEVQERTGSADLAAEAERIIREAANAYGNVLPRRSPVQLGRAAAFALGAASSSALIGTVALIIGLS